MRNARDGGAAWRCRRCRWLVRFLQREGPYLVVVIAVVGWLVGRSVGRSVVRSFVFLGVPQKQHTHMGMVAKWKSFLGWFQDIKVKVPGILN